MAAIGRSLETNPDSADRDVQTQFKDLVSEPLKSVVTHPHQVLLVIDALDECESEERTRDVLHLILTTYYSGSLPSSLFVWIVMAAGTAATVVFAEQACVRREMREGLQTVVQPGSSGADVEEIEMGTRRPAQGLRMD